MDLPWNIYSFIPLFIPLSSIYSFIMSKCRKNHPCIRETFSNAETFLLKFNPSINEWDSGGRIYYHLAQLSRVSSRVSGFHSAGKIFVRTLRFFDSGTGVRF